MLYLYHQKDIQITKLSYRHNGERGDIIMRLHTSRFLRMTKDEVAIHLRMLHETRGDDFYMDVLSSYQAMTKQAFIDRFSSYFQYYYDCAIMGDDDDYRNFISYWNFATYFRLIDSEQWHKIESATSRFR